LVDRLYLSAAVTYWLQILHIWSGLGVVENRKFAMMSCGI